MKKFIGVTCLLVLSFAGVAKSFAGPLFEPGYYVGEIDHPPALGPHGERVQYVTFYVFGHQIERVRVFLENKREFFSVHHLVNIYPNHHRDYAWSGGSQGNHSTGHWVHPKTVKGNLSGWGFATIHVTPQTFTAHWRSHGRPDHYNDF